MRYWWLFFPSIVDKCWIPLARWLRELPLWCSLRFLATVIICGPPQHDSKMTDEVFILRYNQSEVIAWLLCARRLPVHKDIVVHIAKVYLLERRYHFAPSIGICCDPIQLRAYQSMMRGYTTIVNTPGRVEWVAGIAGICLLQGQRVCVLGGHDVTLLTCEMVPEKRDKLTVITGDLRGVVYNVLIILNGLSPILFFNDIIPMLIMMDTKVLIFGDCAQSQLLRDLARIQVNGVGFTILNL